MTLEQFEFLVLGIVALTILTAFIKIGSSTNISRDTDEFKHE